jgi:hypothetical protein
VRNYNPKEALWKGRNGAYPACKMPQIVSPDSLAKNGFNFAADFFQVFPYCGRKTGGFFVLGDRGRKFKVLSLFQLFFNRG